jgi:hypothetical protein
LSKISKKELIVILVIVTGFTCYFSWILSQISWKAARPPALEENRIVHPNGFSIIAPDTWRTHIKVIGVPDTHGDEPTLDSISAAPWAKVKRTPLLKVYRWVNKKPGLLENYKLVECSWFAYPEAKCYQFQADYYFNWEAIIPGRNESETFELRMVEINDAIKNSNEVPDRWKPFLNSFRIHEKIKQSDPNSPSKVGRMVTPVDGKGVA